MTRFEQIKIGDKAEISHKIADKDIQRFVELTGDDNKIHIDKEYASRTSFKIPVAHGMLSASFISTLIGTKIPGDGALWFSQSLEFLLPVRVGDEITISAEVIAKHDRLNIIELQTNVYNQDKQKVISGKAKVKVIEQNVTVAEKQLNTQNQPKIALILGGTGGIGSATCMKLADMGYNVAIHYHRNEQKASEIVKSIESKGMKAMSFNCDLMNKNEINEIVNQIERRLGNISLFINCATVKIPKIKLQNLDWDDLEKQILINIKVNLFFSQVIAPNMKETKNGKFIFLTTQFTENVPPTELLHYVTAKSALNGFAKALSVELAPYKINVNLVSPGMTETELIADIPEKALMLLAAKVPLKRLGNVEDVANVIGFLASDNSGYITGETIRVSGGQTMI